MKIIIKYNIKLSKWIIFLNTKVLFSLKLNNDYSNKNSIFLSNYLILLKILRQFGLKKPVKNLKQYI